MRARRRADTIVWAGILLMVFAGVYLTQSRGIVPGRRGSGRGVFIASDRSIRRRGLLYSPLLLLVFAVPGIGNRLIVAFQDVMTADENANGTRRCWAGWALRKRRG